jgi:signal transduction histidine kinase
MAVQDAAPRAEGSNRQPGRAGSPGWPGWTTRQWLRRATAAAFVLLILLGALGVWAFARAAGLTNAIVDQATPAYVQAVLLETALVNQETGIRGYGLSGQTQFLAPYTDGLTQQKAATAQLRTLLAGDSEDITALDDVLARAAQWQQQIAEPIAAQPPGGPIAMATERADQGVTLFNAVRASAAAEQRQLLVARVHARSSQRDATDLCDWLLSAIAAVILLLAILVFEGLRRGVTAPLGRLSADARQVADGDLGHTIAATGPRDLRILAEDVEGMRRRLLAELAVSDHSRTQLDEQAAELRRSNAELEQFAYVASHDLQEPLRKVASFCQLLQRRYAGQLDERADQYIKFAVDGAQRMQTLINDLLAFSRVGRVHASHQTVDLEAALAGTVGDLSVAIEETGAEITHDPLPTVDGDPSQLGMLLHNLIGNAIKFHQPGSSPHIHISAEPDGPVWRMSVSDDGIGIEPQYAEKIFVIFQRLHTREAYAGNGIGLAMCKKIVEFHGGAIALDPDHSPGTRFTFTLTAAGPAPDPVPAPQDEVEEQG